MTTGKLKPLSTSALRRRRQSIKRQRAQLKRELAAIEAEMASRKEPKPSALVDAARWRW